MLGGWLGYGCQHFGGTVLTLTFADSDNSDISGEKYHDICLYSENIDIFIFHISNWRHLRWCYLPLLQTLTWLLRSWHWRYLALTFADSGDTIATIAIYSDTGDISGKKYDHIYFHWKLSMYWYLDILCQCVFTSPIIWLVFLVF